MIAEPPAPTLASPPARSSSRLSRAFSHTARLFFLLCAGVVLETGFGFLWVLSYRLTHGNDFTYQFLTTNSGIWERLYKLLLLADRMAPGFEPPSGTDGLTLLVNSFVIGCVVAGVGYLAAVLLLDLGISSVRGALPLVLLVELATQLLLFLSPGLYTTDIFSYVMYGHISAIYALNPYVYPPAYFPGNPMLAWIPPLWHNTPSVYGPLWTDLSWLFAWPVNTLSQLDQVLAYKLAMNVVQLVNLALVWWLLGRFAPQQGSRRARLVAFTLFAWNPLMLFDVAGNAHNDGLMITLLLVGLVPVALHLRPSGQPALRRAPNLAWLLGILGVTLSALVKYTSGLAGLFFLTAWLRQLRAWRARVGWTVTAGVAALGLTVALFWPWLQLPQVAKPILEAASGSADGFLSTNSVPDLVALTVANQVLDPSHPSSTPYQTSYQETARFWMKVITRAILALYLLWEVRRVWIVAGEGDTRRTANAVVEASTRAFLVLILLALYWVMEWYFTWPLALAALLGWRSTLAKMAVAYTLTALPIFYIHHYWNTLMPGWWVLIYAGVPLALLLLWQARGLAGSAGRLVAGRTGLNVSVGRRGGVYSARPSESDAYPVPAWERVES